MRVQDTTIAASGTSTYLGPLDLRRLTVHQRPVWGTPSVIMTACQCAAKFRHQTVSLDHIYPLIIVIIIMTVVVTAHDEQRKGKRKRALTCDASLLLLPPPPTIPHPAAVQTTLH